MRIQIDHTTIYHYSEPPRRLLQLLRLTPSNFLGQSVIEWRVDVDCDARLREGRDGYGNITHMLYVERPVQDLAVSVTGMVLTENHAGIVQGLSNDLPPEVFLRSTKLTAPGPQSARLRNRDGCDLTRKRPIHRRVPRRLSPPAMVSVRTSRRSSSLWRGSSAFRRDTSRGISIAAMVRSSRKRRMPGRKRGSRISAGSRSIRRMACRRTKIMSGSPAAWTIAASPISGARIGGGEERLSVEVLVNGQPEMQVQN
jgi:hypothetical protein